MKHMSVYEEGQFDLGGGAKPFSGGQMLPLVPFPPPPRSYPNVDTYVCGDRPLAGVVATDSVHEKRCAQSKQGKWRTAVSGWLACHVCRATL